MNSPVLNIPSKEKNFWRWRALWLFFGRYQASFKGIPSPFLSKDYLLGSFQEVLKLVIQLPLTFWCLKMGPKIQQGFLIQNDLQGFFRVSWWHHIDCVAIPEGDASEELGIPGEVLPAWPWYICQIHLLNHRWRVWWSASFKSINPDSVVKKVKGQSQSLDLLGPQGKSWHPFIIHQAYKGDLRVYLGEVCSLAGSLKSYPFSFFSWSKLIYRASGTSEFVLLVFESRFDLEDGETASEVPPKKK